MGQAVHPFLWGVATSAFQIEGHIENDMTAWERSGRFRRDGRDPRVGIATDHWNRWESDFRLLRSLGVNSYRFSIEWARVEPEPGKFDQAAIDQYARMLARLREYGIVPMVTLHHFTHPVWFHSLSPWHKEESIGRFLSFVRAVAKPLLRDVPLVVTLNEPMVWLLAGYGEGVFPPGIRDLRLLMESLANMLTAHRRAYEVIRGESPSTQVGIAHNMIVFARARMGHFLDGKVVKPLRYFYNRMIPETFQTNRLKFHFPLLLDFDRPVSLNDCVDFWGVNYYYRMHVRFRLNLRRPFEMFYTPRAGKGQSALGWEIYPKGLRRVCGWLEFTQKPLYITENGIATNDDSQRVEFLRDHAEALEGAIARGYPIRGYYHWSLLDNYEWLHGTSARFGLYSVRFDSDLHRLENPSVLWYRHYIREQHLLAAEASAS